MSLIAADLAVLSMGDGPSAVQVAGLRRRRMTLGRTLGDRTPGAATGWAESSPTEKPARAELVADGYFLRSGSSAALCAAFVDGASVPFALALPEAGTWTGHFHIRSLTIGGDAEGEVTLSIRLSSNGPITFTPQEGS